MDLDIFFNNLLFYVFGALAIVMGLLVIFKKNPVTSAVCMGLSFASTAAILFILGAHFLGVIQLLVYTGAIMVLIVFIVMMMNIKEAEMSYRRPLPIALGILVAVLLIAQVSNVAVSIPSIPPATAQTSANSSPKAAPQVILPEINPAAVAKQFPENSKLRQLTEKGEFPDASLLGYTLFSKYNATIMIVSLVLLAAAVGVVALSRKVSSR